MLMMDSILSYWLVLVVLRSELGMVMMVMLVLMLGHCCHRLSHCTSTVSGWDMMVRVVMGCELLMDWLINWRLRLINLRLMQYICWVMYLMMNCSISASLLLN